MTSNFSTLGDLLAFGIVSLKNSNISNYKKEAEWLLLNIIDKNSTWFITNKNCEPTDIHIQNYLESIYKRSEHIPLQLIMGRADFYGRDFIVYPDVFIPRSDSEIIIDIIKKKTFTTIIDVGCGTGCIGITLSLEIPNIFIDVIDVSHIAIENTNANIKYLDPPSIRHIFQDDILKSTPNGSYDLIISNPPYISLNDVKNLEHSVQYYDPLNALSDLGDGLSFYRRIFNLSKTMLNKGGSIILEFGKDQQIQEIVDTFIGFQYYIYNDTSNQPRIIELKK